MWILVSHDSLKTRHLRIYGTRCATSSCHRPGLKTSGQTDWWLLLFLSLPDGLSRTSTLSKATAVRVRISVPVGNSNPPILILMVQSAQNGRDDDTAAGPDGAWDRRVIA